jgi:hypothetical protein
MRRVKRGADGVVSPAKRSAGLTTPASPPLLFKEGKKPIYLLVLCELHHQRFAAAVRLWLIRD